MKTITHIALIITISVLFSFILSSCKDDVQNIDTQVVSPGITGKWQFTTTPLNEYIDTTNLKGRNGSDFHSDPSINEDIYLYESNNQILGFSGPFKLRGAVTDSIRLEVFEPVDGRYGADTSTIKSFEMTLSLNVWGHLSGNGKIVLDRDTSGVLNNTYSIYGIKTDNITPERFTDLMLGGWLDDLCKYATEALSFVIGELTYDVFRPMANCWGHKNGGGFYVFGDEGPGDLFPLWTSTVYAAVEWSACGVRVYDFNINYNGGSTISINTLKEIATSVPSSWLEKIGFGSDSAISAELDAFYGVYGNFALTLAYNLETRNAAIYVNVENGSTNAHTHPLAQKIKNALASAFGTMYLSSGRNISDSWHMRRSDFLVCNTSLSLVYLFGTANIDYD